MTSDPFILDTIQHCRIEFKQGSLCDQHNVRVQRLNSIDENINYTEVPDPERKEFLRRLLIAKGNSYPQYSARRKKIALTD